jgi:hypothetical protein
LLAGGGGNKVTVQTFPFTKWKMEI